MARLQSVFVDTNELFQFTIIDTLLTLADQRIFPWVWTDELIDESLAPDSDDRVHAAACLLGESMCSALATIKASRWTG